MLNSINRAVSNIARSNASELRWCILCVGVVYVLTAAEDERSGW